MQFAHLHTDDPLGLATAGDIVLADLQGGDKVSFVEMLSELGIYIPDAAQAIKPVTEKRITYELRSSTLTIPLGVLVNTSWLVTALSVGCNSSGRPTVNVTAIQFSDPSKYMAPPVVPDPIEIVGGFGLVNKWGCTTNDDGISSSMSISMSQSEAMEETSGDYLEEGYLQYGFKQDVTLEAFSAITPPVGAKVTDADNATSKRDGRKTYSTKFFVYL